MKTTSTQLFYCYGVFPGGIRRECYNLLGRDANKKMLEYKRAGAVKVGYDHMPIKKRTVWGA